MLLVLIIVFILPCLASLRVSHVIRFGYGEEMWCGTYKRAGAWLYMG